MWKAVFLRLIETSSYRIEESSLRVVRIVVFCAFYQTVNTRGEYPFTIHKEISLYSS